MPQKTGKGLDEGFTELAAVEIKILAGFIVALLLLLIGGSYTYRTNAEFADAVEWTAHRQEVRAAVASIYGSLAGAEVALRDYLPVSYTHLPHLIDALLQQRFVRASGRCYPTFTLDMDRSTGFGSTPSD